MRTSACSPTTTSVCAHCAVPGSSISQTTWIGFSTRTFFGTWMNTPPVQNAAVPAANLPSSMREALAEVLLDQLRVLLHRLLERHDDDLLVVDVGVDDVRAALDDQRGVRVVAEVELAEGPGS